MSEQFLDRLARADVSVEELEKHIGRTYVVDRAIAACPISTQQLLLNLAQSIDRDTRQNVVCNARTPADVLISLAAEFPAEFFAHPLLDLMILEDPQILTRLEPGILNSFLGDPGCPNSFIRWACRYGYRADQLTILRRTDLSVDRLRIIARGPHAKPAEQAMDRLVEMGETW